MKLVLVAIASLILGAIFGIAGTMVVQKQSYDQNSVQDTFGGRLPASITAEISDQSKWNTYMSQYGFTFQYPPEYGVSEGEGVNDSKARSITIYHINRQGPPVMVMEVLAPSVVNFSLWEGIGWEWFDEVMSSFRFTIGAPPYDAGPPSSAYGNE